MKMRINPWWLVAALAGGVLLGGLLFSGGEENQTHENELAESVIYTCSMHPQIRQQETGLCPICAMDLIPLAGDGASRWS